MATYTSNTQTPLERMYLPKKNTSDFKVNDSSQDVMK